MDANPIVLQVGVKILLKNEEGRYLLLRRSLKKYPEIKGRWDIVGGRINPGTSLRENLEREIKEETGLSLNGNTQLVAAQDILRNSERHVVRLTYTGEASGTLMLDTQENDMYQWYSKEELNNIEDIDIYLKELLASGILKI